MSENKQLRTKININCKEISPQGDTECIFVKVSIVLTFLK